MSVQKFNYIFTECKIILIDQFFINETLQNRKQMCPVNTSRTVTMADDRTAAAINDHSLQTA